MRKWLALAGALGGTCLATTIVCDVPVGAIYDALAPAYYYGYDDDYDDYDDDDDCCYDDCCGGFWFDGWWWW
jgi:hypothetical protein